MMSRNANQLYTSFALQQGGSSSWKTKFPSGNVSFAKGNAVVYFSVFTILSTNGSRLTPVADVYPQPRVLLDASLSHLDTRAEIVAYIGLLDFQKGRGDFCHQNVLPPSFNNPGSTLLCPGMPVHALNLYQHWLSPCPLSVQIYVLRSSTCWHT